MRIHITKMQNGMKTSSTLKRMNDVFIVFMTVATLTVFSPYQTF